MMGAWTQASDSYPVASTFQSCVVSSGYMVCVGGETSATPTFTGTVYYAPISIGSIGPWKSTSGYPDSLSTDCAAVSGYVYCVGGYDGSSVGETPLVEYASLSALTS